MLLKTYKKTFPVFVMSLLCFTARAAENPSLDMLGLAVSVRPAASQHHTPSMLPRNQIVAFPLKNSPAGSYHLAVEVRSADETGEDGKRMLGGYNYLLPKPQYQIAVNGKTIPMELSCRPPIRLKDDPRTKKPVYAGWLLSPDPVHLKSGDRLTVCCCKTHGFVRRIVLLDDKAWEAEKIRASDIAPPRSDVGWGTRLFNHLPMRRWYRLRDLDDVVRAMEIFSSGFGRPYLQGKPYESLIAEGKSLHEKIQSYRKTNSKGAAVIEQGAALSQQWQEYFAKVDKTLRKIIPPVMAKIRADLDFKTKGISLNKACWAGREGTFNRDVALQYLDGADEELIKLHLPEDLAKRTFVYLLTYVDNAAEFAKAASEFAAKPQKTVEFPEYFVPAPKGKNQPSVPAARFPRGEICLNGIWDFAINTGPDNPPKPNEWPRKQRVPHEAWGFGINKNNISDEKWLKQARGYWSWWEDNVWYHTEFNVPADWAGRRFVIAFEEVENYAEVFVNGRYGGNHHTGLIPFEIDVTKHLVPGARNNILVFVKSPKKTIRPGLNYRYIIKPNLYPTRCTEIYSGGITGEVFLRAKPFTRITETYVRTWADKHIRVETTVKNGTSRPVDETLTNVIRKDGKNQFTLLPQKVHLEPGEEKTVVTEAIWPEAQLWGIGGEYGSPENLYFLVSKLGTIDTTYTEFGFRELTIKGPNFYFNGVRLPLQGDNFIAFGRNHGRRCRWYINQLFRLEREANINFTRGHQQSMYHEHAEIANRIGILLEPEACGWYLHPPSDIISQRTDPEKMKYTWPYGNRAWEDPVWRNNYHKYYRELVKRYRNDPSVVIFSAENECLDHYSADTIYQFAQWIKEIAPHLIVDCHSNESVWDDRFEIANFHDYDVYIPRMAEWARVSGSNHKPVIIGEFYNYSLPQTVLHGPREQARAAEWALARWTKRRFSEYSKKLNAAPMYFCFETRAAALCSNGDLRTAGPWGDRIADAKHNYENIIHPDWPSMSGRGGYRVERFLSTPNVMSINFSDPARVAATKTKIFDTFRSVFQDMPGWLNRRQPELIVTVLQDGNPVSGINVFLLPKENQATAPIGVKTDSDGKAWFIMKEPGKYAVQVSNNGKVANNDVTLASTMIENRGGFEYIPRATVDLDHPDKMTVSLPKKTPLHQPKSSEAKKTFPAVPNLAQGTESVSPEGFIRDWLLCGPFPGGGREVDDKTIGWNVDHLAATGGEWETTPRLGERYRSEFKENQYAYWKPTTIDVTWRRHVSFDDYIDLGKLFQRNDVKGLDFSPVQFVVGYAACTIESPSDQDAILSIGSDDGYKLYLNHRLIKVNRVYRGVKKDEDNIPVALKKGKNLLLLKVEQDIGGYGFYLRIMDKSGKVVRLIVTNKSELTKLEKDGWICNWLVCGPFANPGRRLNETTWATDYLVPNGGEAKIKPAAGMSYVAKFEEDPTVAWTPGQANITWRFVEAQNDAFVNLGKELVTNQIKGLDFPPVEKVLGYAAVYVYCDKSIKTRLEIDTINGVKAWLNHEKVFDKHVHRYNTDPASPIKAVFEEGNYYPKVELKKGMNVLLLKLDVANGPFRFRCRFVDEKKQPISNLRIGI